LDLFWKTIKTIKLMFVLYNNGKPIIGKTFPFSSLVVADFLWKVLGPKHENGTNKKWMNGNNSFHLGNGKMIV